MSRKETVMHDGTNEPGAVPVPDETRPAARWSAALLLGIGIGGGVGLAVGVLLTVSVSATYTLFTPTIKTNRELLQVFDELNEMRQQINRINEERNLKDQQTVDVLRQALDTVASTARPSSAGPPGAVTPA